MPAGVAGVAEVTAVVGAAADGGSRGAVAALTAATASIASSAASTTSSSLSSSSSSAPSCDGEGSASLVVDEGRRERAVRARRRRRRPPGRSLVPERRVCRAEGPPQTTRVQEMFPREVKEQHANPSGVKPSSTRTTLSSRTR